MVVKAWVSPDLKSSFCNLNSLCFCDLSDSLSFALVEEEVWFCPILPVSLDGRSLIIFPLLLKSRRDFSNGLGEDSSSGWAEMESY